MLRDEDLYLFNEGNHTRVFEKLGSHLVTVNGEEGANFAVWAPNAREVFLMGDFNHWSKSTHALHARGSSGIWECFIPGIRQIGRA